MKKTFNYLTIALLIFSGCQMHEKDSSPLKEYTLKATLEGKTDTKTHLSDIQDGIYYPYWSEGDDIAVFIDGSSTSEIFRLQSGENTAKGSFTGNHFGSDYIAYYPLSGAGSYSGGNLNVTLPAEQVLPEKATTFAEGSFPMIAVSQTSDLQFKNLCSVLKLSLVGEGAVKSITFKANDPSIPVSGEASISIPTGDNPVLNMKSGGSNQVTLKIPYFAELDKEVPCEYFIVIPSGTYKGGFTVLIETFAGTVERSTTKDITFERSQFRAIPTFECVGTGEIDPDDIPYNQIWYVTTDGAPIDISNTYFDRQVVSHVYENGKGIITFDGTLTAVGGDEYANRLADYRLTEIHLPNTVETIGDYCLNSGGWDSFHVPDNLKSIGISSLDSRSLKRIYGKKATPDEKGVIIDGVLIAYAYGSIGETLEIPEGTVSIANGMFNTVSTVKEVIFPEGFKTFGNNCFGNCSNLQYVTLPSTYNETSFYYSPGAFDRCGSLLRFKGDSPCVSEDGVFLKVENGIKVFGGADLTDYTIPEGIERINFGSLYGRNNLKSLTFPSTLKNNEEDGWDGGYQLPENLEFFYGSNTTEDHHSLVVRGDLMAVTPIGNENYTVPDGVTRISAGVLSFIKGLKTLKMSDSVKMIKYPGVSGQAELEEIVFSANLEEMELYEEPFGGDNALKRVYFRSYYPPSIRGLKSFTSSIPSDTKIYVPKQTLSMYQNNSTWAPYKDYFTAYEYDDLAPFDPGYYVSTDYSADGQVSVLQQASKGNGINLILMGDAFSDRQIADGTYEATMKKMMEAFFSEEPYTTYRDLFNVYTVNVVSLVEGYENAGQTLSTWFGDGTHVGGDDSKCMDYALKAIPEDKMNSSLIIVAMNSTKYAGTCYMYNSGSSDYGQGVSVAYFPMGQSEEVLAQLVHHEAGGHGFGKLDDEYSYENKGQIPADEITSKHNMEQYGWWKNVDFTSDPASVKWAKFINDSRYAGDNLGVIEGACTYWTGAYRPTENSIMRHNTGGFNAPSREAIWYRMHKLAYGDSWTYNYEEFVSYDQKNIGKNTTTSSAGIGVKMAFPVLHAPVVVNEPWEVVHERGKAERNRTTK